MNRFIQTLQKGSPSRISCPSDPFRALAFELPVRILFSALPTAFISLVPDNVTFSTLSGRVTDIDVSIVSLPPSAVSTIESVVSDACGARYQPED